MVNKKIDIPPNLDITTLKGEKCITSGYRKYQDIKIGSA